MAGARSLSYAAFAAELDAVCAGLQAAGMRPGDHIVFSVRPSVEAVILILSAVRCGAVVVAVDPGMSPALFAARTAPLRPRWVMTESLLYAAGRLGLRSALERRGMRLPNFDVPDARLILVGWWPSNARTLTYDRLASSRRVPERRESDPEAPALVVFTSGTTSEPKGVVHTQRSLSASIDMIDAVLKLHHEDRVYSDQLHMIVPGLLAGAACFLPRGGFSAVRALGDLNRVKPTHVFWAPVQLQQLIAQAPAGLPDSLRTILLGSAPVPADFLRRCRSQLPEGTRAYAVYALTEMLPVCWVEMEEKLAYEGDGDLLGRPCPGVRLLVSADGEILVSGPNLCSRYIGQPPLTEVATGDIGRLDGDRLVLLGRKKNMIIRGAHNIYPELVEEAVAGVPGVRRCAMVGIYRDLVADELVVLVIEPVAGVDGVKVCARVRNALWEGPQRIDVDARPDMIVAMPIPLGGRSRKVDRDALRASLRSSVAC